ncbi:MAG: RDD family protein [Planctomycetota bacterium]|jgi:uncharacterized RDD family membrane protein YckC
MWRRGIAFLIDLVPLFILAASENVLGIAEGPLIGLANLALVLWYDAGMNYQFGGTIGKRAMNLRVALPQRPDVLPRLLIRTVARMSFLALPLGTVYALIAIWRHDGRTLADFVSGSTVVDATTYQPPRRMSLCGRICASLLTIIVPWLFLIAFAVLLFGALIVQEIFRHL